MAARVDAVDAVVWGILNRGQDSGRPALECTRVQARHAVRAVLGAIAEILEQEDELHLPGIGVLEVRPVPEHQSRNPRTGELATVPERHRVAFRVSGVLKERVRQTREAQ